MEMFRTGLCSWLYNSVNLQKKKKKIIELYTQKNEHYSTKIVTQ